MVCPNPLCLGVLVVRLRSGLGGLGELGGSLFRSGPSYLCSSVSIRGSLSGCPGHLRPLRNLRLVLSGLGVLGGLGGLLPSRFPSADWRVA